MKKFFKDLFGGKKKKDSSPDHVIDPPVQIRQQRVQMPMHQNQLNCAPMQYQQNNNNIYHHPGDLEFQKRTDFDLTNDRIPLAEITHVKGKIEINPEEIISVKLKCSHEKLSKHDYEQKDSKVPLLVSINTEDIESDEFRKGIDLVLVIDVSSSMSGSKIKLVRETLDFVLGELEARDRCCLVRFNSNAEQITGFKSMNDANKKSMRQLVKDEIQESGCTDIRKAMEMAFDVMHNRDEENDTTAVFLLSDGEDTCGNDGVSIKKAMEIKHKLMEKKNYKYQIHSFGYGEGHDEKVLSMISDFTGGNFYYIKTDAYVDECFIDCFGYLMSVFATNVELELELLKGFQLNDVFSILWTKHSNKKATLKIHGLAVGKTLEYITEIGFLRDEMKFLDGQNVPVARITMKYFHDDMKYVLEKNLQVGLVEKETDKGEPDPDVEEAYAKAEGVRTMENARKLVEQGKQKEAESRLKDYHTKMDNNKYLKGSFKSKMVKTVKMDYVVESKDFMQVNKMMCENAYNPEYESFQVKNSKQQRLYSKKKGF